MPRKRLRVKRHTVTQPSDPSYRLIPLTQGQNAIVDTADFEWLSQWNWFADHRTTGKRTFVAKRNQYRPGRGPFPIFMHREILGCLGTEEADHKNGDTLDNRRSNLRKCTPSQNSMHRPLRSDNKTGFRGVWFCPEENKWRAHIASGTKRRIIGRFNSAEEAAHAYDGVAKELHGEFAVLNFPESLHSKL